LANRNDAIEKITIDPPNITFTGVVASNTNPADVARALVVRAFHNSQLMTV